MNEIHKWTDADVAYMRKNYGKIPAGEIAKMMGIRRSRVFDKAQALGLAKKKVKYGYDSDDVSLIMHLRKEGVTLKQIAEKFDLSYYVVKFIVYKKAKVWGQINHD